jgi:hypothetical protein
MVSKNPEIFKNTTEVVKAYNNLWAREFEKMEADLINYYNQLFITDVYKNIIFDAEVFEFSQNFDRASFDDINKLFSTYKSLGTYEAIIAVVKAFLGATAQVSFSDNGQTITITGVGVNSQNMTTVNDENIVTPDGTPILTVNNRLNLKFTELEYLIRLFLPAGIKYTILSGS